MVFCLQKVEKVLRGGAWVPSITVFKRGKGKHVDVRKTIANVLALHENGAEGVVLNGTTGEGHLLRHEDKLALINAIGFLKKKGVFRKDFVLLTGTGTQKIEEARDIIAHAKQNGFDGILALPHKDDSLKLDFYHDLANACKAGKKDDTLALILYHHPKLDSSYSVTPELLAELRRIHENVVGAKDSSGERSLLGKWIPVSKEKSGKEDILLAVGEDFFVHAGLKEEKARAAIAGAANTPRGLKHLLNIFNYHRSGNYDEAEREQALFDNVIRGLLAKGVFRDNAKRNRIKPSERVMALVNVLPAS